MARNTKSLKDIVLLVLCGPTAVGKTELSLRIGERFSCEIVGVDSMQVHRHMDIGTAKPTAAERARLPHHLIDIVDPDENYTLGKFVRDAEAAIREIYSGANIPLLTGGTGMYLNGLLKGVFSEDGMISSDSEAEGRDSGREDSKRDLQSRLVTEGSAALHRELTGVDPVTAQRVHPNDIQRIVRGLEIYYRTGIPWSRHLAVQDRKEGQYRVLKIGLRRPRQELYSRIGQRVQLMVEQGLLDEVKKLLDMGYDKKLKSMQSIGYRHMINFIEGRWSWEQALELLVRDTRRFAKRQFTWFNRDPEITWHDVNDAGAVFRQIEEFLRKNSP